MNPEATILIPTHDHGPTLLRSVPTALAQTVENVEVFIVGDGVPDETRDVVADLRREDRRVRFFDNPKGPHRGEVHRHTALAEARGRIVCYLTDDDLWLPDHVATMRELLSRADFAHALPIRVEADGTLAGWTGDLSLSFFRHLILSGTNFIPLPCGTHTLEMYRKLPHGWRTTPSPGYTDLYMWQQFLAQPECRAVSGTRLTVLYFHERAGRSMKERLAELDRWVALIADPDRRARMEQQLIDVLARDRAHLLAEWMQSLPDSGPPEELLWTAYQVVGTDRTLRERRARAIRDQGAVQNAERKELERKLERTIDERDDLRKELDLAYGSLTWRLRSRLLRVPVLGAMIRSAAARRARRGPR